jgi:hypothetical protein
VLDDATADRIQKLAVESHRLEAQVAGLTVDKRRSLTGHRAAAEVHLGQPRGPRPPLPTRK